MHVLHKNISYILYAARIIDILYTNQTQLTLTKKYENNLRIRIFKILILMIFEHFKLCKFIHFVKMHYIQRFYQKIIFIVKII